MKMYLAALGLLLILASGAAQARQADLCAMAPALPGAWEALESVPSAGEWLAHGAVQAEPESGLPTKIRTQARIGFRHRNPHLGILRFYPQLDRDRTGTRYGDGYIVREEIVRSVLKPGGPGPPVPVGVIRYSLAAVRRDLVCPCRSPQPHFQSGLRDPS